MYLNRDESYVGKAFESWLDRPNFSRPPRVVSLFAGCGGLDYAFHSAGYESSYVNEWNLDAASTYERNFGVAVDSRPIEDVDFDQVGPADLV